MSLVRAKFRLNSFTTELHRVYPQPENGPENVEKRTLNFTPVGFNEDKGEENSQFWDATPSGSLQMGVVNPEAWQHFELGVEYYLDFTRAD